MLVVVAAVMVFSLPRMGSVAADVTDAAAAAVVAAVGEDDGNVGMVAIIAECLSSSMQSLSSPPAA